MFESIYLFSPLSLGPLLPEQLLVLHLLALTNHTEFAGFGLEHINNTPIKRAKMRRARHGVQSLANVKHQDILLLTGCEEQP